MLDDAFLRKVRESYPAPIAQVARRFHAASEDGRRLVEAHKLAHALILTLGTISLAWCHYRELRPDGVQHWYDKFQRSAPTLGDWLGAARAGAKLASEIGVPLSGLETALGSDMENKLLTALEELVWLRNRYVQSTTTAQAASLGTVERHLRAALDACDFLAETKFVIVEGNERQRSGGFRITVRAVAGDNPIFLRAPAFLYPQALYSETLYLLQESGDHLEIAPFWVAREAKGENGWELFYLNKRVDRGRGFEYVSFFKPDDSFVDHELPKTFSWFGDRRRSPSLSGGERESPQSPGRNRPVKASMRRAMLEQEELNELYAEHRDMMWRAAQGVLQGQAFNGVSAEDIVMTVMAELAQKGIPDDEDGRPFNLRAYLRTSVVWRAIDALRRAERLRPLDPAKDLTDSTSTDPHTAAVSRSFLQRFDELLRKLSANERYVFQEHLLNGRPAKDAARELDVSPPRVSQLVTAALKKLKEGLGEEETAD